ncbi:hypothetical protein H920_09581 [Fukomys damarensis]|uniref:Uncharacterized protein n=1 Tax=Fukomys damarensis TaxID=885580 RepID=A0A091DA96_FUKDA|nr:hypothetical protein H920_09581 [Fukomys damarensis]
MRGARGVLRLFIPPHAADRERSVKGPQGCLFLPRWGLSLRREGPEGRTLRGTAPVTEPDSTDGLKVAAEGSAFWASPRKVQPGPPSSGATGALLT